MSNLAICRPCRHRLFNAGVVRSFTTSIVKRAIPPESPDYVYVPKPIQPDQQSPRIVKGRLPVPREIFPSSRPEKLDPNFAHKATPAPRRPFKPATATDQQKHRHRMSELRKDHLRKGLVELRSRKAKVEHKSAIRSQVRREERARLLAQAEREDERLTSSTVLAKMLPVKGQQLPDPGWEDRHKASLKRYEESLERKSSARLNALHTLYMNSRTFIVDEQGLDAEIEASFKDVVFNTPDGTQGKNIWSKGVPPKVADLLKKTADAEGITTKRGAANIANEQVARISAERIRRLAGELSGGKL